MNTKYECLVHHFGRNKYQIILRAYTKGLFRRSIKQSASGIMNKATKERLIASFGKDTTIINIDVRGGKRP